MQGTVILTQNRNRKKLEPELEPEPKKNTGSRTGKFFPVLEPEPEKIGTGTGTGTGTGKINTGSGSNYLTRFEMFPSLLLTLVRVLGCYGIKVLGY